MCERSGGGRMVSDATARAEGLDWSSPHPLLQRSGCLVIHRWTEGEGGGPRRVVDLRAGMAAFPFERGGGGSRPRLLSSDRKPHSVTAQKTVHTSHGGTEMDARLRDLGRRVQTCRTNKITATEPQRKGKGTLRSRRRKCKEDQVLGLVSTPQFRPTARATVFSEGNSAAMSMFPRNN